MVYKVLKNNLFFLIPYVIILLTSGFVLVIYSKPDIHIWLNSHNSGFSDWVFSHVTFLGDGIFVIFIGCSAAFLFPSSCGISFNSLFVHRACCANS